MRCYKKEKKLKCNKGKRKIWKEGTEREREKYKRERGRHK